ncbi:DEAD/DEAH box helicase [Fluviicola sp.]|uniref:DEAD/DEAH box helicase n=1 Tax=Fluviicola sp. TaxID=1917219 RepID=UPI0031D18C1D
MKPKISVSVDQRSLNTSIKQENISQKALSDLRVILGSISSDSIFREDMFIIPWYDFKRVIVSVSRLLKSENIELEFDEFGLRLLNEFLSDRKELLLGESSLHVRSELVESHLKSHEFGRNLKLEQERDASKLLKLKHGANFSVPGAGKTTTILAVHSVLKKIDRVSTLFVISPINAFISWEDEIADIFKEKPLKVLRMTTFLMSNFSEVIRQNPDVILINYEKMRKKIDNLSSYFIANKVHLVLDESHRIKSGNNNQSFSQIVRLSDLAVRRDILSGTPMPQSYLDLEPQFDFLWPAEKIIPDLAKENEESRVTVLNQAIKELYVRTTKKELGLRDPLIVYTKIPMGPIQNELYRLFKSESARILAGMDRGDKINFRRIGKSVVRLLQASTNPMLLATKDEYIEDILPIPEGSKVWQLLEEFVKYEKASKIEYLKDRVKEITSESENNKIVIWSYFVRNIQLLERLFKDYNPVSIYGGIPTGSDDDENSRESRIRKFHEDNTCRLMIANPQACGEGISLHKVCHNAIYLDRSFNAAHFLQSIDRIHRLGLDKSIDTKVEILVSENSIDEVLQIRLNEKILNMGAILDDPYLQTLAYDPFDISLGEEDGIDAQDFEMVSKHILSNE